MIFINTELEGKVATRDKTRIDVSRTFAQGETITQIEIQPEGTADYYDVTTSKYLDWQYSTDGFKSVVVRVTGSVTGVAAASSFLEIVSAGNDNLFSADADLKALEDDILNYIRNGRNSFKDKHREAQKVILNELDASRIWKDDGTRYEAVDIVDVQEFKQWSTYLTLRLICESLSNEVGDLWADKAQKYNSMAIQAKSRATYRLDSNADGEINEIDEKFDTFSNTLVRR
jgi:hypothetical protein